MRNKSGKFKLLKVDLKSAKISLSFHADCSQCLQGSGAVCQARTAGWRKRLQMHQVSLFCRQKQSSNVSQWGFFLSLYFFVFLSADQPDICFPKVQKNGHSLEEIYHPPQRQCAHPLTQTLCQLQRRQNHKGAGKCVALQSIQRTPVSS